MTLPKRWFHSLFPLLLLAACATAPKVDLTEPRRMLGTESDVRLDAEIRTDTLTSSQQLPIQYAITNLRSTPIAVADLLPDATYDPETRVVTISLGTEVPGEQVLPRLTVIPAGQKKEFSISARVLVAVNPGTGEGLQHVPAFIQMKLNFLNDPSPFQPLIGIPERAVRDPKLAASVFPKWLEDNETLTTNTLPMRWGAPGEVDAAETGERNVGKRPRRP